MSKIIATESDAYDIVGSSSYSKKCCTYSKAIEIGCEVSGSYSSNQLVCLNDLSKKVISYDAIPVNISVSFARYNGTSTRCLYGNSNRVVTTNQNITEFDVTEINSLFYIYAFSPSDSECAIVNISSDTDFFIDPFSSHLVYGQDCEFISMNSHRTNENYGYTAFTFDWDYLCSQYTGNKVYISMSLEIVQDDDYGIYQN